MIPLTWYLVFSFMMIGLGGYGMMVKRNLIRILIGAEIMGNGVNVALVAISLYTPSPFFYFTGQGLIMLVISVSAAHTALALVLMLMYNRRYHSVDLGKPIEMEGR